jgi:hypothetical protein
LSLLHDKPRGILKILSHRFSYDAKTNACEVVDGESRVLWNVHGEHTLTGPFYLGVFETLGQFLQTHAFHNLAKQYFDEYPTTGRGIILRYLDAFKHSPSN